jgi:hypothetical protein
MVHTLGDGGHQSHTNGRCEGVDTARWHHRDHRGGGAGTPRPSHAWTEARSLVGGGVEKCWVGKEDVVAATIYPCSRSGIWRPHPCRQTHPLGWLMPRRLQEQD